MFLVATTLATMTAFFALSIQAIVLVGGIADIQLLYAIPLVIAISFVYGATRHEMIGPIIDHSIRALIWIVGFMGLIFVVLWFLSRNL